MRGNRGSRGETILNRLSESGALTDGGKAFLMASLDPFHDTPIANLRGWPDLETSPSVIRKVVRQTTITRPVDFDATHWCFQVVAWPWHNVQTFDRAERVNNVITSIETDRDHGGVEVTCLNVGAPSYTGVGSQSFNMAWSPQYVCELGTNYTKGLGRLIGLGYEISDDTADLYKQGHSYHTRLPNQGMQPMTFESRPGSVGVPPTWLTATPIRPPPGTAQDAMLYNDSVDWPAKEGCYVVSSFADENLPTYVGYTVPYLLLNQTDDVESVVTDVGINTDPIFIGSASFATPTTGGYAPAMRISNIDLSTSMFTGLNPQASFNLTVHYYFESFPAIGEPDILVLAQPSAVFDPLAIAIYSEAVQRLPVAVPVGMNPTGEWWAEVIKAAAEALSPVVGAFAPEFLPLLAAGSVGLQSYARGTDKKKKVKVQVVQPAARPPPRLPPRTAANYPRLPARTAANYPPKPRAPQRARQRGRRGRGK